MSLAAAPTPFKPVLIYQHKKTRKARAAQPGKGLTMGEPDFNVPLYNLRKALEKYELERDARISLTDEMERLPSLDTLNSSVLAAALVLLFFSRSRDNITPTMFKDNIERAIVPIEPDLTIDKTIRDAMITRLQADILRYCRHIIEFRTTR